MVPADTAFRVIGGARIGVNVSAEALAQFEARLGFARLLATTDPPSLRYRATTGPDGSDVFERHDPLREHSVESIGGSIDDLVDDLHLSIALHATDEVFVHAGVVAWNGRAILLPGRSRAGKSTLVYELVRAGATYLSDEYARITSSGEIAPYPRPIQLRTAAGRRLVDPRTVGCVAATPFAPGLVVFTHHRTGAAFDPVSVLPARAALELFDNTVVAEVAPRRATKAVAQVARVAAAVRSDRDESADAASSIIALADKMFVRP